MCIVKKYNITTRVVDLGSYYNSNNNNYFYEKGVNLKN